MNARIKGIVSSAAIAFACCLPAFTQGMQVEGPVVNKWLTLKSGGYVLIIRKGTIPGLTSSDTTSKSQKPVFVVNYRTTCKAGQKAEMLKEATQIIPSLRFDLSNGKYGGLMLCAYQAADDQPPLEMFMFNRDKKGAWHHSP